MTAGRVRGDTAADGSLSSVESYRSAILAAITPLAPTSLELGDAEGCVLAEDVTAAVSLPSFDNSSMDGYAVVAADTELQSSKTQVNTITVSAVDWAAVIDQLGKTTPAGLSLSTFTGSSQAPAGTATPAAGGKAAAGKGAAAKAPAAKAPAAKGKK